MPINTFPIEKISKDHISSGLPGTGCCEHGIIPFWVATRAYKKIPAMELAGILTIPNSILITPRPE